MDLVLLSLWAALSPTLLGATTVMLFLPRPRSLMLGYLLGALMCSVSLGLVVVFSLSGSGWAETTKQTLNPIASIILGLIVLLIARVLSTERDAILKERRARRKAAKGASADQEPALWQRTLNKGTARAAFVVGALLTLPGASYLVFLSRLAKEDLDAPQTVLAVLGST